MKAAAFIIAAALAAVVRGEPGGAIAIDLHNLPPRSVAERRPERPIPRWLQTHLRIGHLPPAGFEMVEEFLKAGYNVVTVNADVYWSRVGPSASLYPREVVERADGYLRRLTESIHRAGAKSVLYIGPVQVPWNSKEFREAHPDWLRIRPNGKPDPSPNFASIRSGYAGWLLEQLAYVTRTYRVDGYWLDGYAPVHLHTYDEATRRAYREASGGKEIPLPLRDTPDQPLYFDIAADPVAREYVAWHEKHFVEFADRMREAVRRENPEAVLFANHSASRTWYYPDMTMSEYPGSYSSAIDVSSVEFYWDVPGDPLYHQFVLAFLQGATRDRGGSVWIQPTEHGISGTSSPVEIQLRGLECLGWGIYPEFVESARREEYLHLQVENLKARERWIGGSRAISYLGVVASEETRALYGRAAAPLHLAHLLGAFRSILETHWPVRILSEYDLEDGDLQGVRVVVLPNVAALSDRAAEVLRRFVRAGGGLVASFESTLHDGGFRRRADFGLGDLFRAKHVATHQVAQRAENLSLSLEGRHPILDDPAIRRSMDTAWRNPGGPPPDSGPVALVAGATEVTPLEGGEVIATYRRAVPGKEAGPHPAIIVSESGKGRVVYFAAAVDQAMFFYPDGAHRKLIARACQWAARGAPPLLEVKGPLILATCFREQPESGRLIVHLTNPGSSWGEHSISQKWPPLSEEVRRRWGLPDLMEMRSPWPIREEVIPLHDIQVTCRKAGVRKATLEPGGLDLPLTRAGDAVTVNVPRIEMHSMVIFE